MAHRLLFLILLVLCLPGAAAAAELTIRYDNIEGQMQIEEETLDIIGGSITVRLRDPAISPGTANWSTGDLLNWTLAVRNTNASPTTTRTLTLVQPAPFVTVGGTYDPALNSGQFTGEFSAFTQGVLASGGILSRVSFNDYLEPNAVDRTLEVASFSGLTPSLMTFTISNIAADEVMRDYDPLPEPTGGLLLATGVAGLLGVAALRRRIR